MQVSVWKYIIHTVYLLHVTATHVVIFMEVHYKEYIHRNITDFLEPMHRYKMLNFKDNARFKNTYQSLKYR